MGIVAARIDNRLLHGIVATQWTPEYHPQRLMVIDDEYAGDPTKKASMRMARPSDVALSIISEQTALANFAAGKYDDHSVFVVTKSPRVIAKLIEDGQVIPHLVLGGTTDVEADGAVRVSRRAIVLPEEVASYRDIARSGCSITVQYVPADKAVPLASLIEL